MEWIFIVQVYLDRFISEIQNSNTVTMQMNETCRNAVVSQQGNMYYHTNLLTPWRWVHFDSFSTTTQGFPRILWNLKIHYLVRKRPSLVSVLRQMNPVHTHIAYLSNIHLILFSCLCIGIPSGLSLRFSY
jgi:hypothetical protein